ncbi:putative o-methyltransferase b protein [Botrytis fragariae]|uniref:Putative o-methyltransferase b protein n=1 Tax=Botrytis fragariae TaxID=1964551 RepID=A0A8H6ED16_9HELO|nr:putative o-methyltransferase b protein [Botrytis fragariae]KAF5867872.1 putative o-methyltransferase b protein [Botrytis fragariae]
MDTIKTLAEGIQNAAATANEAGRKELLDSLRDLQYSIEKPEDTMQRVIHLKPLFVDIGGASGQQCIEFRKRFPDIEGRVISQDLPGEIEHAMSQGLPDGVEAMVRDFYTPQQGAKFYYLRAILHDHLDDKAILILKNIMQVMEKDALILLDEMVLPNCNVDWFATQTDLTMLAAFGSMERTEAQWKSPLESVGLKLRRTVTYTQAFRLSIIAASL